MARAPRSRAWIAIASSLLVLAAVAEIGYRAVFRWRLKSLQRFLLAEHAPHSGQRFEYIRFGESTDAPGTSLVIDMQAYVQRRRGSRSALDSEEPSWRFTHAYAGVRFGVYGPHSSSRHVFYWSPSRLTFYHAANWGGTCLKGCPWRLDPQLIGIGPASSFGEEGWADRPTSPPQPAPPPIAP
jgi:hypothetical protein